MLKRMKEEDDEFMCYVGGGEYDKVRQAQGTTPKMMTM